MAFTPATTEQRFVLDHVVRIGEIAATGGAGTEGAFSVAATDPASGTATDGWVRFNGGGYGHRAGRYQYGAQGLALLGVPCHEILAHYYPGTELRRGNRGDASIQVRVGLSHDAKGGAHGAPVARSQWRLRVAAPTKVTAGNTTHDLMAGTYNLSYKAGEGFRFEPTSTGSAELRVADVAHGTHGLQRSISYTLRSPTST